MNINKTGFTIVELIVVITILAILGTIGFVSFSSHLVGTRDTNRLSQLSTIHEGLDVYSTQNDLPTPENSVEVRASGSVIGYQGYVGKSVLGMIGYSKGGKDPKDEQYYSYYLTEDKKNFQLMAYLEDDANKQLGLNLINQANAIDYSKRYSTVYGKKLGILTESGTNSPIQEITSIVSSGYLDIVKTTNSYKANFTDQDNIIGTGIILAQIGTKSSCKRILEIGGNHGDGVYKINPIGTEFEVYCDMTNDGGGWTLVANIQSTGATAINAALYDTGWGTPDLVDTSTGSWIIEADLYDSIGQMIRINMGTVRDFYKPIVGSNLKGMVMTNNKHTWSNKADGSYVTPVYISGSPAALGGSVRYWPSANIPGDSRERLSFWGGGGYYGCCHDSITTPGGALWTRKFSMWIR